MSDLRTVHPWGPEGWAVVYAPDLPLQDALERFNAAAARLTGGDEAGAAGDFADLLLALLKGWTIRYDTGAPYPLTRDALLALGVRQLVPLGYAVTEDMLEQRTPAASYAEVRREVEAIIGAGARPGGER